MAPSIRQRKSHPGRSKDTVRTWLAEDVPRLPAPPLRCTQEAGDVLFLPPLWAHAVLNLAESVGYAAELEWGVLDLELADDVDVDVDGAEAGAP